MKANIDSIPGWYDKGSRFYPHWWKETTRQFTGLIHLIMDIYSAGGCLDTWVEIGSDIGESATVFLAFPFVKKLHCVDIEETPIFKLRLEGEMETGRCEFHHMASTEFAGIFNDQLDVVYIDGDHAYESAAGDIALWYPKLRPGGVLCGHDYHAVHHPGVVRAVDEFVAAHRLPLKRYCDSSWMVQKLAL